MAGPTRRRPLTVIAFLLPAMTLIFFFVVIPIAGTILISFLGSSGITLDNYVRVALNRAPDKALVKIGGVEPPPWGALIHNIIWIAIHLPVTILLGLSLAYILKMVYGASIVKSIVFLGMVVPMVVGGLIIRFMFESSIGVFPLLFEAIRVESLAVTWTAYPETALIALIIGSIWLWTGFSLTVYSAALESIPQSYIEAARIDGASHWSIFWRIVFPLVKPATIIVAVMTILWDLKIFDIVYVATLGGPGGSSNVMALVMYNYFARALDYGASAAVAVILALITLIPGIILAREVMRGAKAG